jgi:hypothetical protein
VRKKKLVALVAAQQERLANLEEHVARLERFIAANLGSIPGA